MGLKTNTVRCSIIEMPTGGKIYVNGVELLEEIEALSGLDSTELGYLDGVTAGTVTASKAVVVDANKDVGDLRNVDAVNIDAGASGTAGSVDVFPTTASKGKLTLSCTDQTGDTTVTVAPDAMGQATTVHIPDPGAADSYVAQSTAALTLAEVDVLDGAVAGTGTASKAVVLDANGDSTLPGEITSTASATGLGDVALRLGATATEGLEIKVYEETVSPAAVETNLINTPSGAVLLSVQGNVETALVAGGTSVTWALGTAADPDKYGYPGSDTLAKNSKVNTIPDWAVLASSEQMVLTAAATGGTADGDTAFSAGSVRVRVVYAVLNGLDDAA